MAAQKAATANGVGERAEIECERRQLGRTAYFHDGDRVIDFVLAFKPDAGGKHRQLRSRFRTKFETNLKREGLELEYEGKEQSQDGKVAYLKVHSTWAALTRQAELEGLQKPIQESDLPAEARKQPSWSTNCLARLNKGRNPFALQDKWKDERTIYFTDAFDAEREDEFLIDPENRDVFFSSGQRAYLTWGIMSGINVSLEIHKKKKSTKSSSAGGDMDYEANPFPEADGATAAMKIKTVNIKYLLTEGVYCAAFPLHDSEYEDDPDVNLDALPVRQWPMRKYLYESWGRWSQWLHFQPLDAIRDYFGEKVRDVERAYYWHALQVAMYYAWIGFYTKLLVLPSLLGIVVFLYGIGEAFLDPDLPNWCDETTESSQMIICRACPAVACPFTRVIDLCGTRTLGRTFDNLGTIFFAMFMGIWGVVFLEMWKRRQAELCARWDVSDQELGEEQVRPDYALHVTTTWYNPVTKRHEPKLQQSTGFLRVAASVCSVATFIAVVLALLISVMFYKIVGPIIWQNWLTFRDKNTGERTTRFDPNLMTSITASLANGIFIALMNKIYMKVAWKLTEIEMPRTETQFEESYTYKVFLFQAINFYGALFFLAFYRGQFTTAPSHPQSSCPASGCILDVSIQLFVVFTGKQAINNMMELGVPLLKNWCARRRQVAKQQAEDEEPDVYTRWENDFDLSSPSTLNLHGDYLEMLLQYGFVTMFVPAFPLAPLFALINNVLEIRLDAFKMLTQTRRPVPVRAKDIGPWFNLLGLISRLAIVTNAALIAFTTDFIDRLVHAYYQEESVAGFTTSHLTFVQFVLSPFRTSDWCESGAFVGNVTADECIELQTFEQPGNGSFFLDTCFYRDYRSSADLEYGHSGTYYHVLLFKFGFILLFEHAVLFVQALLGWLIPDVPDHVTILMQREAFIQREAFKEQKLIAEGKMPRSRELEQVSDCEDAGADSWDMSNHLNSLPADTAYQHMRLANGDQRPSRLKMLYRKLTFCY